MRARYKGPAGTGIIELGDDATVKAVFDDLRSKTGLQGFTLKYGPPMAMKTLNIGQANEVARSLGLHGETLTIVPDEARPTPPPPQTSSTSQIRPSQPAPKPNDGPEEANIPWAERDGTLCEQTPASPCNHPQGPQADHLQQCCVLCPATTAVSSPRLAAHYQSKSQHKSLDK